MFKEIIHVGITVTDIDRSIQFYRDILGLTFKGEMTMEGDETDKLFNMKNIKVRVAYLQSGGNLICPPVELLQFYNTDTINYKPMLNQVSISEICFKTENIEEDYKNLQSKGVEFISEPQFFDLSSQSFGKSKAVYFKDPDGIVLELIEVIE